MLARVAEDIPVKIWIPMDFVVFDINVDTKPPLLLRRLFLSTVNANIDVGAREINLNINGKEEKFMFETRV
jgi:hypothetical protein